MLQLLVNHPPNPRDIADTLRRNSDARKAARLAALLVIRKIDLVHLAIHKIQLCLLPAHIVADLDKKRRFL